MPAGTRRGWHAKCCAILAEKCNVGGTLSHRLKILVVDDDADIAESLAALLRLRHHDVRTAYDVERGLQVAKDFEPDAVVLDVNMPRIDGYAAAAALYRIFPNRRPRLIAFTARSAPADVAAARQAGFDFHVSKSADTDDLLHLLGSEFSPYYDGAAAP